MSDPKRLLESRELGELGKSALGAAVELEPPAGMRERVWGDLGSKLPLGGDLTGDLGADAGGGALGGAAGGAAAGGAAAGGASALSVTIAKVTGGLVAFGALAGGGVAVLGGFENDPHEAAPSASAFVAQKPAENARAANSASPTNPAPEPPPPADTAKSTPAAEAPPAPALAAAERAPLREASPPANAVTAPYASARDGSQPIPSTASFPALPEPAERPDPIAEAREESRLVGSARDALRAGAPRRALSLLDQARTRFPAGVLGQERAALGIEALFASGSKSEASERARRFLEAFPTSPHAARVRALVASSPSH